MSADSELAADATKREAALADLRKQIKKAVPPPQIAQALGYSPNAMARGLRRNQTRTIGLLIPDMRNSSFSSEAAIPLQRQLQEFGYGLVLYVSRHDHETELRCIERLQAQQVDGVILVAGSAQLVQALLENDLIDELRLMVFPVVLGSGKRLFGDASEMKALRLVDSKPAGETTILTFVPAEKE